MNNFDFSSFNQPPPPAMVPAPSIPPQPLPTAIGTGASTDGQVFIRFDTPQGSSFFFFPVGHIDDIIAGLQGAKLAAQGILVPQPGLAFPN
jgi:hypothetical protein